MTDRLNLADYETVKERKARFYEEYKDGRIIPEIVNVDTIMEYALIKASIFFNKEEFEKKLPRATGYAMEIRDKELSVSREGKKYESVNFTSWVENAEESAIGRALDNAGYAGGGKISREEAEKAERMKDILVAERAAEKSYNELIFKAKTTQELAEAGEEIRKATLSENLRKKLGAKFLERKNELSATEQEDFNKLRTMINTAKNQKVLDFIKIQIKGNKYTLAEKETLQCELETKEKELKVQSENK